MLASGQMPSCSGPHCRAAMQRSLATQRSFEEPLTLHTSLWQVSQRRQSPQLVQEFSRAHSSPGTRLPADQQKAFGWRLPRFFSSLHPPSWLHPAHGQLCTALQPPAERFPGHHVLLQRPKPLQNRHRQSSSLRTLTVQRYFPHEPRMEMAEGESGRL